MVLHNDYNHHRNQPKEFDMEQEQITIAGHSFMVPNRYTEGHPLTSGEASALNQTFHENIRNNVASKIKKSHPEGITEGDVPQWQDEVYKYAEAYQFGTRTPGGGRRPSVDPETKLALEEASAAIIEAVKSTGQSPPKGKDLRELAVQVLAGPQGEKFYTVAKRRLAQAREASAGLLESLGLAAQ
jgi:hypothetical protein